MSKEYNHRRLLFRYRNLKVNKTHPDLFKKVNRITLRSKSIDQIIGLKKRLPLYKQLEENILEARAQALSEPVRQIQYDMGAIQQYGRQQKQQHDTFKSYNVGGLAPVVFETQGKRPSQEDRYIISETNRRSSNIVPVFLKDSFEKIHNKLLQENVKDGSTANVAYISKNGIVTVANCGDSRSVAFIRDKVTGQIETIRLSKDHKANDPKEQSRIEAAGGTVENVHGLYRVNGLLAIPRSFGDFDVRGKKGAELISHEPDITQVDLGRYIKDPGKQVFIVNSCDGLYEKLHEQNLAKVAQQYFSQGGPQEGLAKVFARAALHSGSGDNITVNVTKLDNNQRKDIIIGTFDGHGGSHTSRLAAEKMLEITRSYKHQMGFSHNRR